MASSPSYFRTIFTLSEQAKSGSTLTIGVEKKAGMRNLRISIFFALLMPVRFAP